ncbi:hypothetical protein RHD99_14930 [Buttiauxella selenatireducens]|uniref:Uncharacterized protein n=1 Tax=Buttiauxella selenatireducens TaxID=3073902 RepID=A0ABY9S734_9ENTR|nr:hypothetical protein [Buttiauxella sp. R73]WMY72765.1 hypothetical protein RHD99_14930 [Buttiauxella sp. R73]
MIAELSAALTAIKETAGLAKVINDAKTDAEVKAATVEFQTKLITLQGECFALGDLIRLRDDEVISLKTKIGEYENFCCQVESYRFNQLDSGALVYSKQVTVNGAEVTVHLCPKCYSEKKVSLLQPVIVDEGDKFHKSKCLLCDIKLFMSKNADYVEPPSLSELARGLNGNG